MSDAKVVFSSNNGNTWNTPPTVGSSPPLGGFDVQHGGSVSYAAMLNKIRKATTLGGAYADYDTYSGASPICIEIPWGTKNSRSANSGSSPQVIVGLDTPVSGNTLFWYVGGSPVDITPMISGDPGIPQSANCITTWLGVYIAAVLSFGGTLHLVTSIDGGTTWVDRGAVDATYLRDRRRATTPGQLYAAGADLKYSNTWGVALVNKAKPNSDDLVFWEVYG